MLLTIYTIIHTLISLIGIFSGLVMLGGWLRGHRLEGLIVGRVERPLRY